MAKPTRKHPGFNSVDDSAQGREFIRVLSRHLGGRFDYEPLASFESGRRHLFTATGPAGVGLIAEAWEEPEESIAVGRWAFNTTLPDGLDLCAELDARRWSAGSHEHTTGEDPFPGLTGKRRKEAEDARREEIGRQYDRLTIKIGGGNEPWSELVGIPRAVVLGEVARNDIRLQVDAAPPPAHMVQTEPRTLEELRGWVQEQVTSRVRNLNIDDEGRFSFPVGSTRAFIEVRPWGDSGSNVVTVFCVTNKAVPRSTDLFEFLAINADRYVLGRLGAWIDDGTAWIIVRNTLLGDTIDPNELHSTVMAVVSTADQLDDEIKRRFGGYLFHEQVPEAGSQPSSGAEELPIGFYL